MADPIYNTTDNATWDEPKQSFPSVESHVIDRSGVNGMPAEHIVIPQIGTEKAAPKNPCSEWSSGPDNNVYLQGK